MIICIRTASMNDGKIEAGFAWAIKVAAYIKKKHEIDIKALHNISGPMGQVHWIFNFDSLAQYDIAIKKISSDEGYHDLFREAGEAKLFDASSLVDKIYETL